MFFISASWRRRWACTAGCRQVWLIAMLVALASPAGIAQQVADPADVSEAEAAVRQVLLDAYVSGVHVERDPAAVRMGFHPEFVMLVNDDARLVTVSLADWLDRMKLDGVPTSDSIGHRFRTIHVTGDAATAILDIYENGVHLYTDYFSLYRLRDGWRIVGKTFYGH